MHLIILSHPLQYAKRLRNCEMSGYFIELPSELIVRQCDYNKTPMFLLVSIYREDKIF